MKTVTESAAEPLDVTRTLTPPAGAAAAMPTVTFVAVPPFTLVGLSEIDVTAGGKIVAVAVADEPFTDAVVVAVARDATTLV